MKVNLVFGSEWTQVELPDDAKLVKPGFGFGSRLKAAENQRKVVEDAIRNPLDIDPLSEAKPSWRVTIAFDDPTVP